MRSIKGTITEYPAEPRLIRFSPIGDQQLSAIICPMSGGMWEVVDNSKKKNKKKTTKK